MTHSFEIKLARAKEHLYALDYEVRAFVASDFYEIAREHDADCLGYVERVQRIEKVPDSIPALFGDCVHNLRSCLDHIVWEIAPPKITRPLSSRTKDDRRRPAFMTPEKLEAKSEFPIFIWPDDFVREGKRKIKLLPQDAQAIIERLQPYVGWESGFNTYVPRRPWQWPDEHPLWLLHELANIDKHRAVHLAVAAGQLAYYRGPGTPNWGSMKLHGSAGPLKAGAKLMTVRFTSLEMAEKVEMDYQFAFGVTTSESVLGASGDPLPQPLQRITEFIESDVLPPLRPYVPAT